MFGGGASNLTNERKEYLTEHLCVHDALCVIDLLLNLNRNKLKQKIDQLKQLGINITA